MPVLQVTHVAGRRIKYAAKAETVGVVVPCSDAEAVEKVGTLARCPTTESLAGRRRTR